MVVERGKRRRPRLALIVYGLEYSYQESVLRGADEAARAENVDLFCFAGGGVALGQITDSTYDVLESSAIDGLLIATSTLGGAIGSVELENLLARFRDIPVCSLGYEMSGTLSVVVDGSSTVETVTHHLIQDHGRRRLAFLEGNNNESAERRAAFERALVKSGLDVDQSLIFSGNFRSESGFAAVAELVARVKSAPGNGFPVDAIVAANDWMALGALRALEAHGVRVPEDVSVVGFDDIDQARFEMPSLTTIRQPAEQLGARGVRAVLAAHRGERLPAVTRLETEQRLRKSCGCFSGSQLKHSLRLPSVQPPPGSGEDRVVRIVGVLADAAAGFQQQLPEDWGARLVQAFDRAVEGDSEAFVSLLESFIRATLDLGNVAAWHHVVTMLRKHGVKPHAEAVALARAAEVFDSAQVLVSAHAERVQGARRLAKEALLRDLTLLSEDLRAASTYPEIEAVLARQLPKLGVPGCVISVHDGKLDPDTQATVIAAYDVARGGLVPTTEPLRVGDLVPADIAADRRTTWIGTAATFERAILGYCMLEVSSVESSRYISLAEQVGASLNAVRLLRAMVEEVTRRERAERERLRSEIALAKRIQTGILPRVQDVRGLSVASAMLPATEVGGDYFDVLPVAAQGAWFAIGDVAGHGLPAGLVMLMIQSIVSAITSVQPRARASAIWTQLNRVLYENVRHRLHQDEHATLTLLRYDGQGRFEFAGAHEDILVHRAASNEVEAVFTPGIWAGIVAEPPEGAVLDTALALARGDTMLLCTDGVLEARNAQGELFGAERLGREFASVSSQPVSDIVQHVLRTLGEWTAEQEDDVSLVVIRYEGDAEASES